MTTTPTAPATTQVQPPPPGRLITLGGTPVVPLRLDQNRSRLVICSHFEGLVDKLGLEQVFGPGFDAKRLDVVYRDGVASSLTSGAVALFPSLIADTFLHGRPANLVIVDHCGCSHNTVLTGVLKRGPMSDGSLERHLGFVRRLLRPVQATQAFREFIFLAELPAAA